MKANIATLFGWAAIITGLFVLLWVLLFGVKDSIDFTDNCHAHGGVVTRDLKCVQEVKL